MLLHYIVLTHILGHYSFTDNLSLCCICCYHWLSNKHFWHYFLYLKFGETAWSEYIIYRLAHFGAFYGHLNWESLVHNEIGLLQMCTPGVLVLSYPGCSCLPTERMDRSSPVLVLLFQLHWRNSCYSKPSINCPKFLEGLEDAQEKTSSWMSDNCSKCQRNLWSSS